MAQSPQPAACLQGGKTNPTLNFTELERDFKKKDNGIKQLKFHKQLTCGAQQDSSGKTSYQLKCLKDLNHVHVQEYQTQISV